MRIEWIPASVARLATVFLLTVAASAMLAGAAGAEVIYRNIPNKHKGLPALGFESDSVWEFGGEVKFAGEKRTTPTVIVDMGSYGCQEGSGAECKTKTGATFEWPITLNVYQVGPGDEVGPLIVQITKTFKIPYRPSASKKCPLELPEHVQGYGKECVISKMHEINFRLPNVTLPNEAIVAVAYNTETYGKEPTGKEGPEDSLNVAINADYQCGKENPVTKECEEYVNANTEPPSIGSDPLPKLAFAYSTYEGVTCGGAFGKFGATGECWSFEQPAFEVKAEKK